MLAIRPLGRTSVVHSFEGGRCAAGFHHSVGTEAADGRVDEFVHIGVGCGDGVGAEFLRDLQPVDGLVDDDDVRRRVQAR
jgi:hypothetical protein